MSGKRAASPTLDFSDEDEVEARKEMRRRIMTVAEARDLPESEIFKLVDERVPRDVSLRLLEFVSTLGILESATVSKSFISKLIYTDEFWKRRWLIDFPDHAREIGSEIPNWCANDTGDGIDLYPQKDPKWDGGFLPWKKYWIWTWFFRRSLTRIFAEKCSEKAQYAANRRTAGFLKQAPYTFVLKPRTSDQVIVSRQGSGETFTLTMRQLDALTEQDYRRPQGWGNVTLKARLEAVVPNPGPDVSLPLAAAFMSNTFLPQGPDRGLIKIPLGLSPGETYKVILQTTGEIETRTGIYLLAEIYLKWYVYEVLQNNFPLRPDETAESVGRDDTDLVKLMKQRMPGITSRYFNIWDILGQQRNPSVEWFTKLSSLLNAPRIVGVIGYGNPEAKSNINKIFLGSKMCSNCGADAMKRCSQCKSKYYCNKKCQKTHWAEHKSECIESGFKEPYPVPTIKIDGRTYEEWAKTLLITKKYDKNSALEGPYTRFDRAQALIEELNKKYPLPTEEELEPLEKEAGFWFWVILTIKRSQKSSK